MMSLKYLMAFTIALTSVEAVTSRHYSGFYDCSGGPYAMCTNLAPNVCCNRLVEQPDGVLNSYITSILFTGLAPTAVAGMYESSVRSGCASNIDSGSGLSLCLSTGSRVTMAGSSYFDILGCAVRPVLCGRDEAVPDIAKVKSDLLGTEGNCTDTVAPDILAMGDGTFYHVGDGVPQDKVDKLYELAGKFTTALETRNLDKESEINLPVAGDLLEFRVKEEDIDPEWL